MLLPLPPVSCHFPTATPAAAGPEAGRSLPSTPRRRPGYQGIARCLLLTGGKGKRWGEGGTSVKPYIRLYKAADPSRI